MNYNELLEYNSVRLDEYRLQQKELSSIRLLREIFNFGTIVDFARLLDVTKDDVALWLLENKLPDNEIQKLKSLIQIAEYINDKIPIDKRFSFLYIEKRSFLGNKTIAESVNQNNRELIIQMLPNLIV